MYVQFIINNDKCCPINIASYKKLYAVFIVYKISHFGITTNYDNVNSQSENSLNYKFCKTLQNTE